MVNFLRRRLQVFVSSTYSDLKPERQAAVEAILTAGHIPAGMELFTSGDESQMDVIKQWINESDVYLLILGGRYGSVERTSGKSYTQLEYEYAVKRGKPLFSCVVTEAAQKKRIKKHGDKVVEQENPKELKNFRALTLSKMSKFWEDSKDIKIAVGETLSIFARRDDLNGWVRPSQEANVPALADEVARLSSENARLRDTAGLDKPRYGGLTFEEVRAVLEQKKMLRGFYELRLEFEDHPGEVSDGQLETYKLDPRELTALCLCHDVGLGSWVLTVEGREFLNRLEASHAFEQKRTETS